MNNKDKIIKLELLGIILLIISLITDILELKSISVVIIIMSPLIIPAIYKEKEEKIENENIKVIKSIEDIEVIRQEEMEHLNNKIKYFERVKNPRKIEEYKRILRNCEILFKVYFKNRMEEKVIPASLKEEKTTIQL